jgi:hypothetical protein
MTYRTYQSLLKTGNLILSHFESQRKKLLINIIEERKKMVFAKRFI